MRPPTPASRMRAACSVSPRSGGGFTEGTSSPWRRSEGCSASWACARAFSIQRRCGRCSLASFRTSVSKTRKCRAGSSRPTSSAAARWCFLPGPSWTLCSRAQRFPVCSPPYRSMGGISSMAGCRATPRSQPRLRRERSGSWSCRRASPVHSKSHRLARCRLVLHALTLLIARQLVVDVLRWQETREILVVPPLCPVGTSPYDFSSSASLIERAAASTRSWLAAGGLERPDLPHELTPHSHDVP